MNLPNNSAKHILFKWDLRSGNHPNDSENVEVVHDLIRIAIMREAT